MDDYDFDKIGLSVTEIAQDIFIRCGREKDFAHQGGTVFGSVNRIVLTKQGWVALRNQCTDGFLEEFKKNKIGIIS